MSSIRNIVVDSTVPDHYTPGTVVDPRSAYTASLHVIFAHVADFHELIIRIISQKYGIPENEMLKVITEHPDYIHMQVSPVIQSLGYFDQYDVERKKTKVIKKKKIVIKDD
jgi:hypothetical protein